MPLRPRRLFVALDKFKGALEADAACEVVRRTILRCDPTLSIDSAPLTDGGDGFCRILTRAAQGELHEHAATGPRFEGGRAPRVSATIGRIELDRLPAAARTLLGLDASARRLAVIDMASVNGLALVPRERMDVWQSSSYGTGELLLAAMERGVDAILLGVGGSATSDLGLGALAALGLRFSTQAGDALSPPLPADWSRIVRIDGSVARLPPLRIACDVDNPVFGERGAAAVYGPQKGLAPRDRPRLEADGERLAALLCQHVGASSDALTRPGSGAAGAIAFGLSAAAGARLVPGWALVDAWLRLDERLSRADCVVTGEGRFDESSWSGKGPGSVLAAARARGLRAVV
ncbi:MAG TPA: glycerate kinase, partial [Polyangiaceae bacterium]|nr:glycerate kinase [Polyangiaceae bacterium]